MTTRRALTALVVVLFAGVSQGCGSSERPAPDHAISVALPAKTLALVVNPQTGAVLAETTAGVYVLPSAGARTARAIRAVLVADDQRIAIDRLLTVAYTDDGGLIGSSHPNKTDRTVPANLGLLVSQDGGKSWRPESLYGLADLHIIRTVGATSYAVDFAAAPPKLMITGDYGRSWTTRQLPGAVTDIAVDPTDPQHAFAVTDKGLLVTHDEAAGWRPGGADAKALAWVAGGPLYLGGADGSVRASAGGDSAPQSRGNIGTGVASLAAGPRGLWALGTDRTVRASTDGGRSWNVRYRLRGRTR
jgi:hypothetical protein